MRGRKPLIARARLAALACLASWSLGGCSWATMTRPPEGVVQAGGRLDCTESKAASALDRVAAGLFMVPGAVGLLATAACADESTTCTEDHLWLALGSAAALGVGWVFWASADDGTENADRCLELRCASGVEASCRKLPPPPAPPPPPEPSPPWEAATDGPPPPEPAPPELAP